MKNYFLVNKNMTLDELVRITGISISNLWFEYFLNIFKSHYVEINEYADLIKFISMDDKSKVIRLLNEYKINGLSFIEKKIIVLDIDLPFFEHVSFKLLKRKAKVISHDEFS